MRTFFSTQRLFCLTALAVLCGAGGCNEDLGLDRFDPDARWSCDPAAAGNACGAGWYCASTGYCVPNGYDVREPVDAGPELPPTPDTSCSVNCKSGDTRCDGTDPATAKLVTCEIGPLGCPMWSEPVACDDGNVCTTDQCDLDSNACVFQPLTDGTECSDENACTTGDRCQAGQCAFTGCACACCSPDDCESDGNACNGVETCIDNVCGVQPDTVVVCDAGNDTDCERNTCDPQSGQCEPVVQPDGTACDPNQPCVSEGACQAGECVAVESDACNDQNDCTDDTCEQVTGDCSHTNRQNGSICNDLDPCTLAGTCSDGTCVPGQDTCGPRCHLNGDLTCGQATDPVALMMAPEQTTDTLNAYPCGLPPQLPGREVAYRFIAPLTGLVNLQAQSPDANGELWLVVWPEATIACLPEDVTCQFGKGHLDLNVTAGQVYDVVVDTKEGTSGVVTLLATCGQPEQCQGGLDEDLDGQIDCADPDCQAAESCALTACAPPLDRQIDCNETVSGDLAFPGGALFRYGCTGDAVLLGPETVYRLTAPQSTWARATLTSNQELELLVLEGHCSDNACIGTGSGRHERVWQGRLEGGETYYLVVDSVLGQTGGYGLNLSCALVPTLESACADGQDEDEDGLRDCEDLDCFDDPACLETCDNGDDDNGDGLVDCLDPHCLQAAACPPQGVCLIEGSPINVETTSLDETTGGRANRVSVYACGGERGAQQWGPELVFALYPNVNSLVTLDLTTEDDGPDLDLFVLDPELNPSQACSGSSCMAASATAGHHERLSLPVRGSKTYYVVVDGPNGQFGDFHLTVQWANRENCAASGDADHDGLYKCMDPDCQSDAAYCAESCAAVGDEDMDGMPDCSDPSCIWYCGRGCGSAAAVTCATTSLTGFTGDGHRTLDWYNCLTVPQRGPEVAFRYYADGNQEVAVSVDGPEDLSVVVLHDPDENIPDELCDPRQCLYAGHAGAGGGLRFQSQAGSTYTLLLDSVSAAGVPYTLHIACTSPENCENTIDDNNDGAADCLDDACQHDGACPETCDNGEDDDADGWKDCDDPYCWSDPLCQDHCYAMDVLTCGEQVVADTRSGPRLVSDYDCPTPVAGLDGAERSYLLTMPGPAVQRVSVKLEAPWTQLHVMVLEQQVNPDDQSVFCSKDACVASAVSDGGSELEFYAKPNQAYYLVVDGVQGAEGRFTLTVGCQATEICGNGQDDDGDHAIDCADRACHVLSDCVEANCGDLTDNDQDGVSDCADDDCYAAPGCLCATAESVTCGATRSSDMSAGVSRVDTYSCSMAGGTVAVAAPGPEHVYSLQAPSTGRVRVEVTAESFDPILLVFDNLCNPDGCMATVQEAPQIHDDGSITKGMTFNVNQSQMYFIAVEGIGDYVGGPYEIVIRCETAEDLQCNDRIDNDLDGLTDCGDEDDCRQSAACAASESDAAGGCSDQFDNDGDGATDCLDDDCTGEIICRAESSCIDDWDNDGDGLTDCDDDDCAGHPACLHETPLQCGDAVDNDGDGRTDCADEDCQAIPPCVEQCFDDVPVACGTVTTEQSNIGQANSVNFYDCAPDRDESGGETVFRFDAASTRKVRVDLTDATGLIDLFLLDGACQANTCTQWGSTLTFTAQAATTYYFVADGFFEASGTFNLRVLCEEPETAGGEGCGDAVDNDFDGQTDCDDAECAGNPECARQCDVDGVVTCDQTLVVGGNASFANDLTYYNCSAANESGGEVVYRFEVPIPQQVTIDLPDDGLTPGQNLDLLLLTGECSSANCLMEDDRQLVFEATPGQTYYIVVDGADGATGQFRLQVDCAPVGAL